MAQRSTVAGVVWLLVAASASLHLGRAELYTALAEMEELLDTETVLIANLEAYISAHEQRLQFLRGRVQTYRREHSEASADISVYLSNPINAYLLTKRLTSDWRSIEDMMSFDVGGAFLENVTDYRNQLKFPTDEDLNGAAVALMRLQDTYKLDTASIARGQLNGVQYSTEMSANDCFELGRQSYLNKDYYHTALWMREAINRLGVLNETADGEQTLARTTRADILEYLAFSVYKQGNVLTALQMTNELLQLRPDHERALGNKLYYESEMQTVRQVGLENDRLRGDDGSSHLNVKTAYTDPNRYETPERQQYERLCRNDIGRSDAELAPLRCRYVTNKSAYLRIGPLKLEEANLEPYIVIYHDVIFDAEIEHIKGMAKPRFRRATVQNHKTGELEVANYRISKSAWLKDNEHPYVERISRRVEDMTGLTTATAEELQVVNYGIGGHYEPHFDFARPEETNAFKSLGTGNRIATVLFYMSDVEQGGSTVFPMLNVALRPRKGTAAVWMNLYASGRGDYRTRHAACPVLTGSKWVCNKWLHEAEQEVRRPCGLTPDHPLPK